MPTGAFVMVFVRAASNKYQRSTPTRMFQTKNARWTALAVAAATLATLSIPISQGYASWRNRPTLSEYVTLQASQLRLEGENLFGNGHCEVRTTGKYSPLYVEHDLCDTLTIGTSGRVYVRSNLPGSLQPYTLQGFQQMPSSSE